MPSTQYKGARTLAFQTCLPPRLQKCGSAQWSSTRELPGQALLGASGTCDESVRSGSRVLSVGHTIACATGRQSRLVRQDASLLLPMAPLAFLQSLFCLSRAASRRTTLHGLAQLSGLRFGLAFARWTSSSTLCLVVSVSLLL